MPTKSEIGTNGVMKPVREHYQAAETSRRMRALKTLGPVTLASVGKAGQTYQSISLQKANCWTTPLNHYIQSPFVFHFHKDTEERKLLFYSMFHRYDFEFANLFMEMFTQLTTSILNQLANSKLKLRYINKKDLLKETDKNSHLFLWFLDTPRMESTKETLQREASEYSQSGHLPGESTSTKQAVYQQVSFGNPATMPGVFWVECVGSDRPELICSLTHLGKTVDIKGIHNDEIASLMSLLKGEDPNTPITLFPEQRDCLDKLSQRLVSSAADCRLSDVPLGILICNPATDPFAILYQWPAWQKEEGGHHPTGDPTEDCAKQEQPQEQPCVPRNEQKRKEQQNQIMILEWVFPPHMQLKNSWQRTEMIDRTMKEAFVIQERDVGNEITERSRDLVQLPADPKVVYANVNFGKGFSSRLWNRRDLINQEIAPTTRFDLHPWN
ncbi:hypothetical protein TURU_065759 [Turdus rufiventris]|nr:hypothetical protein TURU_065759 [Turdus rufiventris]